MNIGFAIAHARSEASIAIAQALGLPLAFALSLQELCSCFESAQYDLKTTVLSDPVAVLRQTEINAREWFV